MADVVELADKKTDDNRDALRRSAPLGGTATMSPRPSQQALIDDLCGQLSTYLDARQIEDIRRAYLFSARAHIGQRRISGEPYISFWRPCTLPTTFARRKCSRKLALTCCSNTLRLMWVRFMASFKIP